MFGLGDKSGLEIPEYDPQISDIDPVRSPIGQGVDPTGRRTICHIRENASSVNILSHRDCPFLQAGHGNHWFEGDLSVRSGIYEGVPDGGRYLLKDALQIYDSG